MLINWSLTVTCLLLIVFTTLRQMMLHSFLQLVSPENISSTKQKYIFVNLFLTIIWYSRWHHSVIVELQAWKSDPDQEAPATSNYPPRQSSSFSISSASAEMISMEMPPMSHIQVNTLLSLVEILISDWLTQNIINLWLFDRLITRLLITSLSYLPTMRAAQTRRSVSVRLHFVLEHGLLYRVHHTQAL